MATYSHAVVWIDHRESRIFHFNRENMAEMVIHPDNPTQHIHHKANTIGSGHAAENQDYYHHVAMAVGDVEKVLITGPANAKTELVKHIHHHDPRMSAKIAGVETVDHPSDSQLVAHARTVFKDDHMMKPR